MTPNSRIHAVVFDMDGVLVDSEPIQYRACQEMVSRVGLELSKEDFRDRWVGHKTIESLAEMLEENGVEADPEELMRVKDSTYHHLISTDPIEPRPGIQWLLEWLRGKSVPCVVASSSSHEDIRLVLKRLGITDFFMHLTSSEDCRLPKPAPDIYLLSAERLGVPAEKCLAIEDSNVGIRAAKAAGMCCIAFPHEYTETQDLTVADVQLEDLHSVPELFLFIEQQDSA